MFEKILIVLEISPHENLYFMIFFLAKINTRIA